LHGELLASCRQRLAAAVGSDRARFQRLEALAGPWVTAHALEAADREILCDLLCHCQELEWELGGRRRSRRRLWLLVGLGFLAGLGVSLLGAGSAGLWQAAINFAEDIPYLLRAAGRELARMPTWAMIVTPITLAAILLLWRRARQ
jgi:hypothetical protein